MHLFIYNIFLFLYSVGIRITSLWNPKARKWREGRLHIWEEIQSAIGNRQTAGPAANRSQKVVIAPKRGKAGAETGEQKQDETNSSRLRDATDAQALTIDHSPLVWMHCSSLGEFEQGRPVMEAIRQQYPQAKILLTFFSPSGYEVRKNNSGADYVMYLPMDSKANARKFISLVQPSLVIWIKYEYWFYYLTELKKKQIPLLLVSGIFRQDQPFFKWYGRLHWYMLESFNHLFVQTPRSKQLLGTIGFNNNVTISGDTRFDRVVQIAEQFQPIDKIAHFCGNSVVVVAGSTWPEDEEEMDHYANTHPEIKFIIAPHEINEDHLKEIEKLFKHTVRFSRLPDNPEAPRPVPRNRQPESSAQKPNVLIIDNIGMLSKLYKYATITYVGGGFGDDGVHNVLEAAVYGKPVVFGPVYDKYIEAVELVEQGGGWVIDTALELEKVFTHLIEDTSAWQKSCEAARNYVYNNKGATNSVMQYIQENRLLTS
ncbi:3-deoxy-D-manno-octulosonic acid transferase [Niastella populi]|uniref:3-deoxy-D-manno-octulosonic acid transferase n=1 Tax=Niastella populi TaxID=550983 RepID=A0A1V9FD42_9BACT|nr:glycosyltransferase N-terminal domain-containing protein [Niastella populi]OQP56212.1 3-deoxy-D-manno-octulosonic acid transferase [Niastella populi]